MAGIRAVIFDVDGVLKRGKTPVEGAVEAVKKIRERCRVFVLSNNSSYSKRSYTEHLKKIGFDFLENDVYVSSHSTAMYIKKRFKPTTVYVISTGGLTEEIKNIGFRVVDGKEGETANIVAVGFDSTLNYKKLSIAYRAIKNGGFFVATNEDKFYPVEDGELPGAGLSVKGLEFATGVGPVVIGKPSLYMLNELLKENGLKKSEVVMVGDSEETDIKMADRAGVKSVLIGKARKYSPTYEINSIKELLGVLQQLK